MSIPSLLSSLPINTAGWRVAQMHSVSSVEGDYRNSFLGGTPVYAILVVQSLVFRAVEHTSIEIHTLGAKVWRSAS